MKRPKFFRVNTAGNTEEMYVSDGIWSCGKIKGPSIHFGFKGGFVAELDSLKRAIEFAEGKNVMMKDDEASDGPEKETPSRRRK